MNTRSPVEVTTKYATTVDTLADAWAFVMARVDHVGPDPSITINPVWVIDHPGLDYGEDQTPRHFEVAVHGMVHEGQEDT